MWAVLKGKRFPFKGEFLEYKVSSLPADCVSLTSVRRGLCRGSRAAWRCRSLCCSCCFLTRWWCSRHPSGPRTPAPPCPTERRRDSSSPADTERGKIRPRQKLLHDGTGHSFGVCLLRFRLTDRKNTSPHLVLVTMETLNLFETGQSALILASCQSEQLCWQETNQSSLLFL